MNKIVKSSIAGAAGIALLLGGAGTFALWSSTANVAAGTINTGTLSLTSVAPGAWDEDIALFVPGDTDSYSEDFTIVTAGDHLKATLDAAYSDVDTQGVTATASVVVTDSNGDPVTPVAGVYTFNGSGTYTATVSVNVAFDASNADNQGASVPLGTVAVNLKQVAA